MPSDSEQPGFFGELKRRRVIRVVVVYALVGLGVAEAADVFFPRLQLPDWSVTLVVALLLLGFPIAVGLSWAFDVGAGGVRRTAPSGTVPGGSFRSGQIAAVGGALIISMTGVAWVFFGRAEIELVENRVAVAAFDNQTGDPSLDPVGRMAADVITGALTRTNVVEVIPLTTTLRVVERFEADPEAAPGDDLAQAMARETGARYVVTGTYYREGSGLRLQAQLLDGRRSRVLSALDPVTGDVADPGTAISALAQRITGAVARRLDPRSEGFLSYLPDPPSYEAYQRFSAGMDLFMDSRYREAVGELEAAGRLDSTYVDALVMRSIGHVNLGEPRVADSLLAVAEARGGEHLTPLQRAQIESARAWLSGDRAASYRTGKRVAELGPAGPPIYQTALDAVRIARYREASEILADLDPRRADLEGWFGYWSVRTAALHMLGEYEAELEVAREGRSLYPDDRRHARLELRALASLGRLAEVRDVLAATEALPVRPGFDLGSVLEQAGLALRAHGHPDEARRLFERAVEWYEERPSEVAGSAAIKHDHGDVLYYLGRLDDAGAVFRELMEGHPDQIAYPGHLGILAALRGDEEEARRYDELLAAWEGEYVRGTNTLWRAYVAANMGEPERAVRLLRQAMDEGAAHSVLLHDNVELEPIRDHPAFREFLRPRG